MAMVDLSDTFGSKVADALGLKRVRDITINIPFEGIVTVTAELLVTTDQGEKLVAILKDYELTKKGDDSI
jgi:hypothetical protein